jgi:hypothetical protein
VTEDSSRTVWLQQARSCLHNADPVLARLSDARPTFDPRAGLAQLPPMDLYGHLASPTELLALLAGPVVRSRRRWCRDRTEGGRAGVSRLPA